MVDFLVSCFSQLLSTFEHVQNSFQNISSSCVSHLVTIFSPLLYQIPSTMIDYTKVYTFIHLPRVHAASYTFEHTHYIPSYS